MDKRETDFDDSDYKKKIISMAGKITGAASYHRIRDKVTHVWIINLIDHQW